jgi:hypothetical protein
MPKSPSVFNGLFSPLFQLLKKKKSPPDSYEMLEQKTSSDSMDGADGKSVSVSVLTEDSGSSSSEILKQQEDADSGDCAGNTFPIISLIDSSGSPLIELIASYASVKTQSNIKRVCHDFYEACSGELQVSQLHDQLIAGKPGLHLSPALVGIVLGEQTAYLTDRRARVDEEIENLEEIIAAGQDLLRSHWWERRGELEKSNYKQSRAQFVLPILLMIGFGAAGILLMIPAALLAKAAAVFVGLGTAFLPLLVTIGALAAFSLIEVKKQIKGFKKALAAAQAEKKLLNQEGFDPKKLNLAKKNEYVISTADLIEQFLQDISEIKLQDREARLRWWHHYYDLLPKTIEGIEQLEIKESVSEMLKNEHIATFLQVYQNDLDTLSQNTQKPSKFQHFLPLIATAFAAAKQGPSLQRLSAAMLLLAHSDETAQKLFSQAVLSKSLLKVSVSDEEAELLKNIVQQKLPVVKKDKNSKQPPKFLHGKSANQEKVYDENNPDKGKQVVYKS